MSRCKANPCCSDPHNCTVPLPQDSTGLVHLNSRPQGVDEKAEQPPLSSLRAAAKLRSDRRTTSAASPKPPHQEEGAAGLAERLSDWRARGVSGEDADAAASALLSQASQIEALRKERDEYRTEFLKERTARMAAGSREALVINALTPNAETKAAYIGEFQFTITTMELDESDEPYECQRMVQVPWTTIKEIMSAIRSRSFLDANGGGNVG